jgi:thiamine-phosphate pyrophosphorylase
VNFPRLYAILDTDLILKRGLAPLDVLEAWLDAGIRLVQLRAKSLASGEMLELADRMQERVIAAGARLVVNDRADIAQMSGAAGVHLGQDDLAPRDIREVVGPGAVVGLSTHNESQIEAALAQPVSYVAIGPVFETMSKGRPADTPVDLIGVKQAAIRTAVARVPLVAIGGITLAEARRILDAGASSIAVISDLLAGGDLSRRARAFIQSVA